MLVIGLTGQTGAGKTIVSRIFSESGYRSIDADPVARQVTGRGTQCLKRITELFSEKILLPDGNMNRSAVGALVFRNPEVMKMYTDICYPYITEAVEGILAEYQAEGTKRALLDAPTLFESGADRLCDAVVSVLAEKETRLSRILERDNITKEQAIVRMDAQPDDLFYIARSRYLIHNNGSEDELKEQVLEVLAEIDEDFPV